MTPALTSQSTTPNTIPALPLELVQQIITLRINADLYSTTQATAQYRRNAVATAQAVPHCARFVQKLMLRHYGNLVDCHTASNRLLIIILRRRLLHSVLPYHISNFLWDWIDEVEEAEKAVGLVVEKFERS